MKLLGRAFSLPAFCILGALLFGLLIRNPRISASQGPHASGIDFVKIADGEFMMGCSPNDNQCRADENPAHRVQITKPFEIGKYEVTQAQWRAVMGSNPSTMQGDNRPVETVTKDDVHAFLNRLTARHDGYRYRLPTEAEWEYAARAGTTSIDLGALDDVAWYGGNSGDETHPVGLKKPNAWGLYDTLGNVREWVEDWYAATYYSVSPLVDPMGPQLGTSAGSGGQGAPGRGDGSRGGFGPQHRGAGGPGGRVRRLGVMRGGGWDNLPAFLRVSSRYNYYGPTLSVSDVGFRAVREPVSP
jgi:formylglycine-generating enzyme required for sulfatase activity